MKSILASSSGVGPAAKSQHRVGLLAKSWRLLVILLSVIGLKTAVADEQSINAIEYSALPGNKIQFQIKLSSPPAIPSSFSTDSPARLVLDFPNTQLRLAQKSIPVGVGAAHSVSAVMAEERARVVFNLNDMVPYDMRIVGNDLILTIEGSAGSARGQQALKNAMSAELKPRDQEISSIDFRRGSAGEGRVLINLGRAETRVDIKEEGQKVVLDIRDSRLPPQLHQKLDVTDFATPVQNISSEVAEGGVRITVVASGEYEYMAYQADQLYTVEFRPLSKEEKETQQKDRLVYSGERLSLNFQDIQIRAVLQLLADFTGLNMVVADTVSGKITLRLKNVPWDQALDILLKSKNLSMRRKDNVVMVGPTKEIADAEALELASKQKIEELAPLKSEYIQVSYAKASVLAGLLKAQDNRLLSERGQVTVDDRTNTLLIQDTAAKLDEIRRLITRLDVPVRQVLIESRIVIANNSFTKDLGVRFGFSGSTDLGGGNLLNFGGGKSGYQPGSYDINKGTWLTDTTGNYYNSGIDDGTGQEALLVNLPVSGDAATAANFLIGKIGSYLLQLELSALQSEGRGEIISSPRVITADKQKAVIKQGQEVPYLSSSNSGTNVQFKEAVLQLDVTPHITPDDRIRMDLKITKDEPDWTKAVLGQPPINKRAVESSVLVDNGETVVLGGVFEQKKTYQKDQTPFFGDLPVVGNLFKRTSDKDEAQELLVFITPKILKENVSAR